ncbi:hypothetical protein JOF53_006876 [Crossiella equi]|uniref:Uncharacterized protein n=1 Tax=Crossiella equi TaxID=130796 RepID=A0ABS5AN43_9PSEU|nr:hypothetical protein [Crossiella equi]MBP2478004.1 hypothetical protein [Crossiella equi]
MSPNSRLVALLSVVGVVAAIISAATDVFGLLKDAEPPASQQTDPGAQASAAPTSAPVGSTAANSPAQPPTPYAFVLDFGYNGVDLDEEKPKRGPFSGIGVVDFKLTEGKNTFSGYGVSSKRVVEWTEPGLPTRQQCEDKLDAESVHEVRVARDRRICVRTDNDRIGLVTAIGPKGDGWELKAQMWS